MMNKPVKRIATLSAARILSVSSVALASDYTVTRGDSLWKIAKKQLGAGSRWSEVYEANRETIANPNRVYAGQVIVRCKALKRFDYLSAQRRNTDFTLQLSELEECLPGGAALEERFEASELGAAISAFLRGEKTESRTLFIRRYWYSDSVRDLSLRYHMSESKVKPSLFRTRSRLRAYLEQEGYAV